MKLSACVSAYSLLFIPFHAFGFPPLAGGARDPLPAIPARVAVASAGGDRRETVPDICGEITAAGQRGTWMPDKHWEVLLSAIPAAELPILLERVAELRSCPAKRALRAALYSRWGEIDPAAAMHSATRESDRAVAAQAFHAFLAGWAHANAQEVLTWCEQLPPGNIKLSAYLAALPYVSANACTGTSDGSISRTARAALAAADDVGEDEARWSGYQTILRAWAVREPAAAGEWAANVSEPVEREALMETVLSTWVRADARGAGSFLATHDDIPRQVLDRMIVDWAATDVLSLVAWTRQLRDKNEANRICAEIVPQWLTRAPDDAAAFIVALPVDTTELPSAMATASRRWIASDLPRLVALWRSLPLDAADRLLAGEVLQPLIRDHPEAAATLLEQLSPGTRRSIPLVAALDTIGRSDAQALKRHLEAIAGADDESAIRAAVCARLATSNPPLAAELTATAHIRKAE